MSEPFRVQVDTDDGVAVVALTGELDLSGVPELDAALAALDTSVTALVIDLAGLSFVDSSGVGALVRAKHQADTAGRPLQVRGAAGAVRKVLDIVALGETIDLTD